MTLAAESAAALFGCLRILRWDSSGLRFFNASHDGFWRSFAPAFALAPLYALLIYGRLDPARDLLRVMVVELSAYVIGWVAFPFLMIGLANFLGRGERYFSYLVAYNWFRIVQALALAPVALVERTGLLPESATAILGTVLLGVLMAYDWFIARNGLKVDGTAAAGLVTLDLILSLFVDAIARSLV